MSKTPRLLAVDLDGTLLDSSGVPHVEDVRAIRAAIAAGVHVSIITGRLYSGTRASSEALGLIGPVGCVDGSHVVSSKTHTTLMHHSVREGNALKLRDIIAQSEAASFIFARDAIIHDDSGNPYLNYVTTWSCDVRRVKSVAEDETWSGDEGVTAVVAIGTAAQISEAVDGIQRHLGEHAQAAMFPIRRVTLPGGSAWGVVVRATGKNKGSALGWIAEHHGIDISETVAVGDWINDVPMFMVAGRSFVMGQAPDEVKKIGSDVLEETSETGGGIARVVRDVFGVRY
ncbi:MAG: HAD hydrolase family protein [Polyangiaceae bacterium]